MKIQSLSFLRMRPWRENAAGIFVGTISLLSACSLCGQNGPVIVIQPQSQNILPGSNVTFTVTTASSTLPTINSGTLQWWLKADAGVVTNGSGQVSEWMDQSGNAFHASQANGVQQPTLEYPSAINGAAAIRFNGNQTAGQGDYLYGPGNLGLTGDFTSFLVYEMDSGANSEQMPLFFGTPNTQGACRGNNLTLGQMVFALWSDDYPTGYGVAANSYRIWTTQFSYSSSYATLFDDVPGGTSGFSFNVTGQAPTSASYYVGGLNSSITAGRNFGGDIAEVIAYQGYLADSDRQAIVAYLEQKYYQYPSPITYQWQFNNQSIGGATNFFLTLTNAALSNSGSYSVIVSNVSGFTQSSNAVLEVGVAPVIIAQPQNQFVLAGSNAAFSVSATGTLLRYQWLQNRTPLPGQTNSTLMLTGVNSNYVGIYSVVVSNAVGTASSQGAVLNLVTSPVILTQPLSQNVGVGSNVILFVSASGGGSPGALPSVASGALQLWLKADAGVVANGSGQVSFWQDQSGHTNDAIQTNSSLQPTLVNPAAIGGAAAIRFNGVQTAAQGDYLGGVGQVSIPDGFTSFLVYEMNSGTPAEQMPLFVGYSGIYGNSRGCYIPNGKMVFTTWTYDYSTGFTIPTNTYRIWETSYGTDINQATLYDETASTATNFVLHTSGQSAPPAGYYVGGMDPNVTEGRNFGGDIAEVIIYQGMLTNADRLAVENYLNQKYYQINGSGFTFQWFLNGSPIPGATNGTLGFTPVQSTNAGTYSVTVTDAAGSQGSSNAVLVVNSPPVITLQPLSQSNGLGTAVTFSAAAGGNQPLGYQWQFNSANIGGATNSTFKLASVQSANAGTYRLVVTNLYGTVISSNAVLKLLTSAFQVVSSSAVGSSTVSVPVQLNSAGNENTFNFSLTYSNAALTYTGATLGSNAAGAFLFPNTTQTNSGHLGIEVELPGTNTFSVGTQQVILVNFTVANFTNPVVTTLVFGTQPTPEQVLSAQFTTLPATFTSGTISIAATAWEGDVSPRTNGDGFLLINDWFQEGRFVAGLDTISNANEFQRADCAPRVTGGDGQITVADWVEAGRYAEGLDAQVVLSGPTNLIGSSSNVASASRIISLSAATQNQRTNSINVQMAAQGNENAIGFTITFNPAFLAFVSANAGAGASNAVMNVNANQAGNGLIGVAMAVSPGQFFAAGTLQLVQLIFSSVSYSNTVGIGFGDAPVVRQVADANASILPVSFQTLSLPIGGAAWPALTITQAGNNALVSWPASAVTFMLQSTSTLGAAWSAAPGNPTTNGGNVMLTVPISTNAQFFRLSQ